MNTEVKPPPASPLFLVLAAVAFVFALIVSRFLFVFFAFGAISFAAVSLVRKERAAPAAIAILALTVGLFFVDSAPPVGVSQQDAQPHSVSYSVKGSATEAASLTYSNAQGGTQQEKVRLPWETSFEAKPGAPLYISAQNEMQYGSVIVQISIDGKEFKTSQASGAYTIASASGSCCD